MVEKVEKAEKAGRIGRAGTGETSETSRKVYAKEVAKCVYEQLDKSTDV